MKGCVLKFVYFPPTSRGSTSVGQQVVSLQISLDGNCISGDNMDHCVGCQFIFVSTD